MLQYGFVYVKDHNAFNGAIDFMVMRHFKYFQ